jgi:hypothetical protein
MDGERVKTISCPNCGGTVLVHMPGESVSVVCQSCRSILKTEDASLIERYNEKAFIKPEIPFGIKGDINGEKWMCLGLIVKKDVKWEFTWREYLLYNPKDGYRWLTEGDGNWTFVQMLQKKPEPSLDDSPCFFNHPSVKHQGRNFRLFHSGQSEVTYCLGEFYWRVKSGERALFKDYVRSGEMISLETSGTETIYSYGIYLEPEVVQKAFNLSSIGPSAKPAPHAYVDYVEAWPNIKSIWLYSSSALFILFLFFAALSDSQSVFNGTYNYMGQAVAGGSKLGEITLGSTQNLEFQLTAPVSNNWFEVAYTLVNKQSGDSMDFDQGVEYYQGYDSDGAWSEGSTHNSKIISSLPAGQYEVLSEAAGPSNVTYDVRILRDVTIYSNFIWLFLALALYPVLKYYGMYSDLKMRWAESDYTPFASSDSGDDDDDD